MDVEHFLKNPRGLLDALKREARTLYGLQKQLPGHDKDAIRRWFDEGKPPTDSVAAEIIQASLRLGVDVTAFQTLNPIYSLSEFWSYEQKSEQGPPDLRWLTQAPEPPRRRTNVADLIVDSPLGVASSPLTGDENWTSLMLDLGFGLSTFKTRRSDRKNSWDVPQLAVVSDVLDLRGYDTNSCPSVRVTCAPKESGRIPNLVNSIGVPSETPTEWQASFLRLREHPHGFAVGLSVVADGRDRVSILQDLDRVIECAVEVTPPFVELNLSCPNLENRIELWNDGELVVDAVKAASKRLRQQNIRLFIKIPYLRSSELADFAKRVGKFVEGIVFRNTLRVRPTRRRERDGQTVPAFPDREFGGLSGPMTFNFTRQGILDLVKVRKSSRLEFAIIAVGGVSSPEDVVTLLNDGADAVQACNSLVFDPLLAWKTRFHCARPSTVLVRTPRNARANRVSMLQARNDVERESLENLEIAVRELGAERRADVSHIDVVDKWNQWMTARVVAPTQGIAQRSSPSTVRARSAADWMRVLK